MRRLSLTLLFLVALSCGPKTPDGGGGTKAAGDPAAATHGAVLQREGARLGRLQQDLATAALRRSPTAAKGTLAELEATLTAFDAALAGVGGSLARMSPAVNDRHAQYLAAHNVTSRRLQERARAFAAATEAEEVRVNAALLLDAIRDPLAAPPARSTDTRRARRTAPRMKKGLAPDLDAVLLTGDPVPMDTAATAQFPAAAPEIEALVGGLADPERIADRVRERVRLVPHHGLAGGALGCARTGACSPADAAALLVTCLRHAGIPARVRYGTVFASAESVPVWLAGAPTPRAAERLLALGGVPAAATEDGIFLEHFWVAARLGDRWTSLDATFPPPPRPAAQVMAGRSRPVTFFKTYLGDARDRTPAAYLAPAPAGAVRRARARQRLAWSADLSGVPGAYQGKIWVGLAGEDASIEIPLAAALETGIWLQPDAEPGTTTTLARHFAPAPVPAYLTRTSFKVVAGGQLRGRLPDAVPGRPLRLEVTLPAGGGTPVVVSSPISAGAAAALTVILHAPGTRFARDRWARADSAPPADQGAARMAAAGATLFAALGHESEIHAQAAAGVVALGPSAAVISTGLRPVRALAPDPLSVQVDGIRLDVARMDQVLIGSGRAADAPGFAARAGAALSAWEARALEIAFGWPSVSAVGAIKVSSSAQRPVRLDRADTDKVRKLPLSAHSVAEMDDALRAGKIIFVAPKPMRRAAWAGETYVVVDPKTGQGAFIVRGVLDGAVTADPAAAFVEAANAGQALPPRTEDARRVGRTAAAYEGWPDLWTKPDSRWIVGVDALLTHATEISGQDAGAGVALPADAAALAPGALVDLGDRGRGVALGEIETRLDPSVARSIAARKKTVPGLDPKTRRYVGPAVLVSVQSPGGRKVVALPADLVR